jgi:hypothetical protein
MQRIIGTIGATLALALVIATSAASASASGPEIRATSAAGGGPRLNPDEGAVLLNDGNLNPGTPRVVGSAYTNAEPDDDSDLLGDESQDPDLGGLDGDPPVTGGGEDITRVMAQLFEADEGDDWFDELEDDEDDELAQTTMEWHTITSYEQLPAYPSANVRPPGR